MAINLLQILKHMKSIHASDLHLKAGAVPMYRVDGKLHAAADAVLTPEDVKAIVEKIVPGRLADEMVRNGSVDFAFSVDPTMRYRCNAFRQRGALSIAMRLLENEFQTFEQLHLPPVMEKIAHYRRGMVLVTGPTGSGKTTTMASLINRINETRSEHIITIEDPIEYVHQDRASLIEQREIGSDAINFEIALKHALRQDPDVILVGEMRDAETILTAVRAAMTGHLVISTLHTLNCSQTIRRIMKYFPPEEHASVQGELAIALKAVVSQRLVPQKGGHGRVPQIEVMVVNDIVAKLIREGRFDDISQVLRNGQDGMQHFDMSLVELVKKELVDATVGEEFAEDVAAFRRMCKGGFSGGDRSGLIGG